MRDHFVFGGEKPSVQDLVKNYPNIPGHDFTPENPPSVGDKIVVPFTEGEGKANYEGTVEEIIKTIKGKLIYRIKYEDETRWEDLEAIEWYARKGVTLVNPANKIQHEKVNLISGQQQLRDAAETLMNMSNSGQLTVQSAGPQSA